MKAKAKFLIHGPFYLNNGKQIQFWEDKWLGNYSLQEQYPTLYNIAKKKKCDSRERLKHIVSECLLSMIPNTK
jgi:hypothetical protein